MFLDNKILSNTLPLLIYLISLCLKNKEKYPTAGQIYKIKIALTNSHFANINNSVSNIAIKTKDLK